MAITANLKCYSSSTWVDPQEIKVYQSGAWSNVSNVYINQSGTWTEVWPLGGGSGINTGVFTILKVILYGTPISSYYSRSSAIEPDVRGTFPFYNYTGPNDYVTLFGPGGTLANYGLISSGPYTGGVEYYWYFSNLVAGEGTSRTLYTPVFESDATSGTVNAIIEWYNGATLGGSTTTTLTPQGANQSMLDLEFTVSSTLSGGTAVMTGSSMIVNTSPPPYDH